MSTHLLPPRVADSVRWDYREVVRKRLITVRSVDEVHAAIRGLIQERASGMLKLHLGPGGIPQSMEFEERAKLVLDKP